MSEVSNTKLRDRIFAGFGAILFLVTASALTIAVIYDAVTNKNSTNNTTTSQVACTTDGSVMTTEVLPAPEVYKPTGTVAALEATDLTPGTGTAVKSGDCLQMKYYGTLASNGTLFDENFTKKTLFQFQLGAGQVIPGWDQGLVGMKVGGTRRLVIPADLAYGSQAQGSIPANSTLVFVVKLVAIKK